MSLSADNIFPLFRPDIDRHFIYAHPHCPRSFLFTMEVDYLLRALRLLDKLGLKLDLEKLVFNRSAGPVLQMMME